MVQIVYVPCRLALGVGKNARLNEWRRKIPEEAVDFSLSK